MSLISTHNFSFSYPGSEPILRSVNLEIEEGSFNVLLGANGSGKTTLLQQLHPVLAAHGEKSGEILWRGENVSRETNGGSPLSRRHVSRETSRVGDIAEHIGFVMQRPESQVVTDKVWHELAFGLENLGLAGDEIRRKVAEIATYFGIEAWFDKDVSDLSGGQQQILNLASTMVLDPQLLILDEPTAQLDPISADNFIQMLHRLNYELGITILAAEHELQKILPFASQVLLIDAGEIVVADSPERAIPAIMNRYPQMRTAMPVSVQLAVGLTGSAGKKPESEALAFVDADGNSVTEASAAGETERGPGPVSRSLPLTVGEGKAWLRETMKNVSVSDIADSAVTVTSSASTHRTDAKKAAIAAHELWFRYDKESPDLLQGLDLSVDEGEIFALVGANGSGKSTLISVLSSILSPYRGWVKLGGTKLKNFAPKELFHNYLAVLPQDPQTLFVGKTVAEDLMDIGVHAHPLLGRRKKIHSKTAAEEGLRGVIEEGALALGISEVLDRHPYDLSGGEQQLAALLKVLLLKPRILLLDEPTKGMDEEAKNRVTDLLRSLQQEGVTTLFVTHDVEFAAQTADRAGMFFNGQVVSVDDVHPFFSTNNFYTTAASRIGRDWFPHAMTRDEVMECIRRSTNS